VPNLIVIDIVRVSLMVTSSMMAFQRSARSCLLSGICNEVAGAVDWRLVPLRLVSSSGEPGG
jgi:hypothetical protein